MSLFPTSAPSFDEPPTRASRVQAQKLPRLVGVIFGLSAVIHIVLVLPTALIHKLLARVTGV